MSLKNTVSINSGFDYVLNNPKETGKHLGKWILVFENKIVASDEDLIKIYRQFQKNKPKCVPFVMKISKEPNMLL